MKRIGDLLSSFIAESAGDRFMDRARNYAEFFSSWTALLTEQQLPQAAAHSRVVELERHVVLAETDHPGWIQILQTKQREILGALQRQFPALDIRGIAFRYASDLDSFSPSAQSERSPPKPAPELPAGKVCMKDLGELPPIEDQDFADILKRLRQSILDREARGP
jgi:hypothetical protein